MPSSTMVFLFLHPPHLLLSWVLPRTLQLGLDARASLVVGSVSQTETKSWQMHCYLCLPDFLVVLRASSYYLESSFPFTTSHFLFSHSPFDIEGS